MAPAWNVRLLALLLTACNSLPPTIHAQTPGCMPPPASQANIQDWVRRHSTPTRADPPDQTAVACVPSQQCQHGSPAGGCYSSAQTCDGRRDCSSGRDELFCEDSLCWYQRVDDMSMAGGVSERPWSGGNLRSCARACNEVSTGCVAFRFGSLESGPGRCVLYFNASRVQRQAGYTLYLRSEPWRSLRLTRDVVQTTETLTCNNGDAFNCGGKCIPFSQMCSGLKTCHLDVADILCRSLTSVYQKQPGRGLRSSTVVHTGRSVETCAAYALIQHMMGNRPAYYFAYNHRSQECRIDCSHCYKDVPFVDDSNADLYVYSPDKLRTHVSAVRAGSTQSTTPTQPPSPSQQQFPASPPAGGLLPSPSPSAGDLLPSSCGSRPLAGLAIYKTQLRPASQDDTQQRVVLGHVAIYGMYPWQVQVEVYNEGGYFEHHCGGVLISDQHVLTAAHCISGVPSSRLQVKVGQHDRRDASEQFEQTFAVENMVGHPEYRSDPRSRYANDLAVLKLRVRHVGPVRFSTHVQPICLPSGRQRPAAGRRCLVSGWGKTDFQQTAAAELLHGGAVPVVSDSFCQAADVYGPLFLPSRMICAGHLAGGTDTCQGDSGGPLACEVAPGRWQVTGIVSYGTGCGAARRPGVYTRVSFYVSWIQQVVRLL